MSISGPSPARPRGVTLIELLVVVGILTMLLGIALAMLRPVMKDMKVREASRMVNAFLAGVQARAVALDRPVGVYLEVQRYGVEQAAAFQVFAAESPPPYAGDTVDARISINGISQAGAGGGYVSTARFDVGGGGDASTDSAALNALCQSGDFIRFNYKGPWYRIVTIAPPSPTGGPAQTITFDVTGQVPPAVMQTPGRSYEQVPYQILRKPRRSSVAPLDLPAPMVIDVANSGLGVEGRFGEHYSFKDDPDLNGGQQPRAVPIIISFKAEGGIDLIYVGRFIDRDNDGSKELEYDLFQPVGAVHLLIGWADKLGDQEEDGIPDNLTAGGNRWVSIGNTTGRITTTENAPVRDDEIDSEDSVLSYWGRARKFAKDAQGMGGGA